METDFHPPIQPRWNRTRCDETSDFLFVDSLLSTLSIAMVACSTVSIVANSSFLIAIYFGVRKGELPLKRFLLVVNRSLADLITSIVAFVYLVKASTEECEDEHLGCTMREPTVHPLALQASITLDYWAVALSYSGIAILTWYAVKSPLEYKVRLSVHTVTRVVAFFWATMVAILCFIYLFTGGAANFDSNGMIYAMLHSYKKLEVAHWLVDLCENIRPREPLRVATMSLLLPIFLYFVAFVSYLVVSIVLFRRRGIQMYRRHFSAVWRLGVHLGIFTLTCLIMGLAYYATAPMKDYCLRFENQNARATMNECGLISPLVRYSLLTALSSIGWFIRMIADPLIDVLIDGVLKRALIGKRRNRQHSTITLSTHNELSKMLFGRGARLRSVQVPKTASFHGRAYAVGDESHAPLRQQQSATSASAR